MKILLTGATGLIGKEVKRELLERGHEVVSVSRSTHESVQWSGDDEFPANGLQGIEGVIHLMGENISDHRWTSASKKRMEDSRIQTTILLKRACEKQKLKLKFWIQGSAIGFYGDAKFKGLLTEHSPVGRGFLSDLCYQWETAATDVPAERLVIVRTGVVITSHGGALKAMLKPLKAGLGGVIGSGEQRMSVIHLEDEVGFIVHAVEHANVSGIYNLVGESPITQKQFIELLAKKFDVGTGIPIPAFAIKLLVGEMGEVLLQDQAVITERMKDSGYTLKYPSVPSMLERE